MEKIEQLKSQIECYYFQPCFWCRLLCRHLNPLFEQRYSGDQLAGKYNEMRTLQPKRQAIYCDIESLMPEHEVYQFTSLIDHGFTLLELDSQLVVPHFFRSVFNLFYRTSLFVKYN